MISSKLRHAVWNLNGGQACAVFKGRIPNLRYAVRNINVCQTCTTLEGILLTPGHTIWNLNEGQSWTTTRDWRFFKSLKTAIR